MYYGYGFGRFLDPTYILVILAGVIALAASAYCNSTMSRYSRNRISTGVTGQEAAERVLHAAGIKPLICRQSCFTSPVSRRWLRQLMSAAMLCSMPAVMG